MAEYLSFEEVAAALKCSISKVRQFVIEDKRLVATRITPNGRVLKAPVGDDPFIYDLDFCSHVSDEGKITSDVYENQPGGQTVVTKVLEVGFLRIERTCLNEFLKLPENAISEPASARWPAHETKNLTALRLATVKWWVKYDRHEPGTAPTNKKVSEWLQKQHDISSTLADAMATILRADGLKRGPRGNS